jgi:tRNA pseudouridine55 synthase
VLLIGRSTRLSRYVTGLDKTYTATARVGAVSDTLDAEGDIATFDASLPPESAIREATSDFIGDILQIPPMASALKRNGKRLYNLHRGGISVERKPRPVTIHRFELTFIDLAETTATFDVSCSSGTYVRTLIADLAAQVGSGAYLTALRRTSVGHLSVDDAKSLHNLTPETLHNRIIQPIEVVGHLPGVDVSGAGREAVCHGRRMERGGVEGSYRVMCGGELLAVYRVEGDEGRAEVVLCAG